MQEMELESYNTKITEFHNPITGEIYREVSRKETGNVRVKKGFKLSEEEKERRRNAVADLSAEAQEERTKAQSYAIRRKVRGYMLTNAWHYFVTLTIDPKKINSFDYDVAKKRLLTWCSSQRRKKGAFNYLFIPEMHKSGAVHFHGVIGGNDQIGFTPAINHKTKKPMIRNGRQVYNLKSWEKIGFSDCEKIENLEATSTYITKYITKDLLSDPKMYKQKRYFTSRGLNAPSVEFTTTNAEDFKDYSKSYAVIDTDENGKNFVDIAIYKQTVDVETGEIKDSCRDTFYKFKNKDIDIGII
ncbi:40S ribosomal protein S17 [Pseudolactococcus carnosus]|uniref:40S ribosomal protein S17 n=1 Tax=Pseudolactococcus carnosus TaxID=2749961 RepID=UPI001FBB039C|nr:40S ribosomal protein S17 [Lactococcus carnosus]